jgi:hypothetical protein
MAYRTLDSAWYDSASDLTVQTCTESAEGCNENFGNVTTVPASSVFQGGYSLPTGKGLTVDSQGVITLTDYQLALANVVGLADAVGSGGEVPTLPDSTALGQAWTIGFGVVVTTWLMARGLGVIISAIKRW